MYTRIYIYICIHIRIRVCCMSDYVFVYRAPIAPFDFYAFLGIHRWLGGWDAMYRPARQTCGSSLYSYSGLLRVELLLKLLCSWGMIPRAFPRFGWRPGRWRSRSFVLSLFLLTFVFFLVRWGRIGSTLKELDGRRAGRQKAQTLWKSTSYRPHIPRNPHGHNPIPEP